MITEQFNEHLHPAIKALHDHFTGGKGGDPSRMSGTLFTGDTVYKATGHEPGHLVKQKVINKHEGTGHYYIPERNLKPVVAYKGKPAWMTQHNEDTQHAEHYNGQLLHSKVPRTVQRNTFANLVAKHGGIHNRKNGKFHVPKHNEDAFHDAASKAGFDQEHHYVSTSQYEEETIQFGELFQVASAFGYRPSMKSAHQLKGLSTYNHGSGHSVAFATGSHGWSHVDKTGKSTKGEGTNSLAHHLKSIHGVPSQHNEEDLVEVGHVTAEHARELCNNNPELWRG